MNLICGGASKRARPPATAPHLNMKTKISAIVSLFAAATSLWAAETNKPNILVIVADDLGYGELSVQGNPEIPTPNIDSLAKNGIRFTSGYVSGPYCSPTRAAFQTGRYQQRFGHEFNPGPAEAASPNFGLSLKETTIGDRFKQAGYTTGWFGKSHLGYRPEYHPLKRGYDEYYGFLGGAHDYFDAASDGKNPILRGTNRLDTVGYTTEAFGKEAVKFIEKHQAQPWFVYLAFNAVHAPLEAPAKYISRFPNIQDHKRQTFAGMLSALDDAVGHVLETLRQTGQETNTLIVFFSDNGGPTPQTTSGNGPLRGFKAQTWEGGVRIPFIVQWKGTLPAGKVDNRPVIQIDILPTALAAAGVAAKPEWHLDGVNLLPYLSGENTAPPHEALYWRFGGQIAIRKGDWKLVKGVGLAAGGDTLSGASSTKDAELYNLANDIGEKHNLASAEPAKVKELADAWNAWNATLVEPSWRPTRAPGNKRGSAPAEISNASTNGPWKSGDILSRDDAPKIANRPLIVSAEIEPSAKDGVIVAQGGPAWGYTLYLRDGKLAFGVRAARQLTVVTADKPLDQGRAKVEARLLTDGKVALVVNDKTVAEGKVPGLITAQPGRGISVGSDIGNVGDYTGPNPLKGDVQKVVVRAL
jgi:arylsulfatase A-like enzyme